MPEEDKEVSISRLTSVTITVSFMKDNVTCVNDDGRWSLWDINGGYMVTWDGRMQDLRANFPPISTEAVSVGVSDVGAPPVFDRPQVNGKTIFNSGWLWFGCVCLLGCCGCLLSYPVLFYVIHRNVRKNNGLPPPVIELILFPAPPPAFRHANEGPSPTPLLSSTGVKPTSPSSQLARTSGTPTDASKKPKKKKEPPQAFQ